MFEIQIQTLFLTVTSKARNTFISNTQTSYLNQLLKIIDLKSTTEDSDDEINLRRRLRRLLELLSLALEMRCTYGL